LSEFLSVIIIYPLDIVLSPRLNANLLQRTEIVALINTLHRFSESLEAVNDFRDLWLATSQSDSEKLIVAAEKEVQRKSKVCFYFHLEVSH
jgi:ERO1-like protein beta